MHAILRGLILLETKLVGTTVFEIFLVEVIPVEIILLENILLEINLLDIVLLRDGLAEEWCDEDEEKDVDENSRCECRCVLGTNISIDAEGGCLSPTKPALSCSVSHPSGRASLSVSIFSSLGN